jgi:hypothetical protein
MVGGFRGHRIRFVGAGSTAIEHVRALERRPASCTVEHTENLNRSLAHAVRHEVGGSWNYQLAGATYSPRAPQLREVHEHSNGIQDAVRDSA